MDTHIPPPTFHLKLEMVMAYRGVPTGPQANLADIRASVGDALMTPGHPLYLLLSGVTKAIASSYRGVGANVRLLTAAVEEV